MNNNVELDLEKSKQANILIDLDSLYDTRLSTLLKIDRSVAKKVIEDDSYNTRIIDEFDYLTRNIFRFYYNLRGIETLKNSLLTKATDLIVMLIKHLKLNLYEMDERKPIKITINTYPYKLSKKSEENVLENMRNILPFSGLIFDITRTNLMDDSPIVLESKYTAIIMYDGLSWLYEYMSRYEESNQNAPRTKLICPALLAKPVIMKKKDDYVKLFENTADSFKPFIDLDFINVDMFNAIEPVY
jgi:hypothetical protein